MKILVRFSLTAMMFGSMLLTTAAVAAPIKTYQVTGPVLEVTDTTITIEKDKEKWQIARDKETKVTGELKPGSKATIQYRMSATTVEVKADAKADKTDKTDKADTKADTKSDTKSDTKKAAKK